MMPGLASVMLLTGAPIGAGGVTPNAMNWANIVAVDGGSNASLTVGGIDQTILFNVSVSAVTKTSGVFGDIAATINGVTAGDVRATQSGNDFDCSVPVGAAVYFSASATAATDWTLAFTVTVKHKSYGSSTFDVTLDTFTVSLSGDGASY